MQGLKLTRLLRLTFRSISTYETQMRFISSIAIESDSFARESFHQPPSQHLGVVVQRPPSAFNTAKSSAVTTPTPAGSLLRPRTRTRTRRANDPPGNNATLLAALSEWSLTATMRSIPGSSPPMLVVALDCRRHPARLPPLLRATCLAQRSALDRGFRPSSR